jgi:drug/metabolite transporter (DMT)-like permease
MDNKNKNYGYLMVIASALMFGSYGVWSRLMGSAFDSFFQGWTRALIILILVVPFALWKKEIIKIKKEDWRWVGVFMVFTSLTQAPLFYAYTHISVGLTSLLFFVTMFLTMHTIGLVFFGEKITKIKIGSSLIAVFGMYLVFSFTVSSFAVFAVMMAILAGIASGGEVAFSKKISDKYSPLYLTIISWVVVLVSNCIISVAIGESQPAPALTFPWFWQVCYSVVSLFAFWIAIIGFKYVDVGIGAIIGLLEIVFSVLFGIIIFHETLSPRVAIGAVLIIAAAALPHLAEMYRGKSVAKQ